MAELTMKVAGQDQTETVPNTQADALQLVDTASVTNAGVGNLWPIAKGVLLALKTALKGGAACLLGHADRCRHQAWRRSF